MNIARLLWVSLILSAGGACTPVPPAPSPQKASAGSQGGTTGGTASGASGCGTVTAKGSCILSNGQRVLRRCDTSTNTLVQEICSNQNQICSVDVSGVAGCRPVGSTSGSTPSTGSGTTSGPTAGPQPGGTSSSSCGTVPATGVCVANKMQWCENGATRTRTCAASETCTITEEGVTACITNSTTSAPKTCPGVSASGTCFGTQMKWCVDGEVKTSDCGAVNCDYSAEGIAYCPQAGCGDIAVYGTCDADGHGYKWCDNGTVKSDTCASGATCTYYLGSPYCDAPASGGGSSSGCGDVTELGTCDADFRGYKWCDNGVLRSEICSSQYSCAYESTQSSAYCVFYGGA